MSKSPVSIDFHSRCEAYIASGGFFNLMVARSLYEYAKQVGR